MKNNLIQPPFYIVGSDLCNGATGPFATYRDAVQHCMFKILRGDAEVCCHDNMRIISQADPALADYAYNIGTADDDRCA